MGKDKLRRYAEIQKFSNVLCPSFEDVKAGLAIKGKWHSTYFKNNHPIVLELGCGGGEYTHGLAQRFPGKNFVGVDIKGARIWKGAKLALGLNLTNVAFVRTRIEFIENVFSPNEVREIWITFPDPQPKMSKAGQRLTSAEFINRYKNILSKDGIVHFKTDNATLFDYSLAVIAEHNFKLLTFTHDLYASLEDPTNNLSREKEVLSISTFYEEKFKKDGAKICYLRFQLE